MRGGASDDPYVLHENTRNDQPFNDYGYTDVNNKTLRSQTIDPTIKTLILFGYGASNGAGVAPGAYTPVNGTFLDNLNIYDGCIYAASNPLLSCNFSTLGTGNIFTVLGDIILSNHKFDRVILVPCNIGGTATPDWAVGGVLYQRNTVGMRRLAARGITPSTPGCTFCEVHMMGENEHGEAKATYIANVQSNTALMKANGFSGRIFVNIETLLSNTVDTTLQAAQAALVDNVTYFAGGNLDTLTGSTYRQADNTHFNNAGQLAAATLIYNAMHLSGAPF